MWKYSNRPEARRSVDFLSAVNEGLSLAPGTRVPVRYRIDGFAVDPKFQMQMRPGSASGTSHTSDLPFGRHTFAYLDKNGIQMGVSGHGTVVVRHFYGLAVSPSPVSGEADDTRTRSNNRIAPVAVYVYTSMENLALFGGMAPHAESGCDGSLRGLDKFKGRIGSEQRETVCRFRCS